MKQILAFSVIILGLGLNCRAQAPSCDDSLLLKLVLFSESALWENANVGKAFNNFMKANIFIDTLVSRGFEGYTFLSIGIKNNPGMVFEELPFLMHLGDYIVAKSKVSKTIYRVQGFYINDVSAIFFKDWEGRFAIKKRKFLRNHFVEGVDLKCLYRSWKANSFNVDKFPCMQYSNRNVIFP
jgi:hypothetical protein